MYYLPRQYWKDFVAIANIFRELGVFHEIGIPTLFNVIDRTNRLTPKKSILYRWADCWGGCCNDGGALIDLQQKRCGHKLNFPNWEVSKWHFERLQNNSYLLGEPVPTTKLEAENQWTAVLNKSASAAEAALRKANETAAALNETTVEIDGSPGARPVQPPDGSPAE